MRISGDATVAALATAVVGLITAWATWRAGHRKARSDLVTAVQRAAHQVIEDLREEIERVGELRDQVAAQHAECQADNAALRREVAELRVQVAELRANVQPPLL